MGGKGKKRKNHQYHHHKGKVNRQRNIDDDTESKSTLYALSFINDLCRHAIAYLAVEHSPLIIIYVHVI